MTNLFTGINTLAGSLPTLPTNGPTAYFYTQWSQYLSPLPHIFLTLIMLFMHSIALIFYYIADAVYSAYTSSFKLLDFMNIFFEPNNSVYTDWNLGNIIKDFLYLGFVIFGIMMMVQWIQFTATSGRKGREWPKGITITVAVISALPMIIGLMISIGTATNQDTMGTKPESIITQLWQGNSTDLSRLAANNFDLDKYKNDMNNRHPITNTQIEGSDYHSVMSDAGYTDGLSDAQKSVFTKKIGGNSNMVDITGDSLVLGKTFADDYPVMKTNWLGIIGGEMVFIIVVAGAIVRLLSSVYKMAFMAGSIVYFGLRDGTQGKRVQQVLGMIEGQITGIVMMPISLIFFFAWVEFAFNTINSIPNLGMWPFTILSIAALLAGGKGLAGGFEMIEQWTGVRSGHNPVASMMLAGQASRMIGGATKSAKKHIGQGLSAISPAQKKKNRELGQKIVNSGGNQGLDNSKSLNNQQSGSTGMDATVLASGKGAKAAEMAGRTLGAMKNPSSLLKNTGRAAGGKVKNGVNKAVGNVKDYAGGVTDNFEGGKQAVDAFNKRHTPVSPNAAKITPASNQPQNVHEALAKAFAGTVKKTEIPTSNDHGSQNNISHAMTGAHQGLASKPNSNNTNTNKRPIVSEGTVVQPKGLGATPSAMSRPTPQRLSGTLSGKPPVNKSLTPDEQKAKDRAWAENVVAKQIAKNKNQSIVKSKEDK
ncbi:pLS20_p028 family conjugation system transmembrane protein [Leuconostoc gasicomitatum]|uniref:pLS20_p028 family conjugation system transmembrane protein n=1 Tax=Leuconostoc gasicomitatum TaxID=115778 RepID=UPI0007E16C68|nr:ion transporter [Leuconostoc gasicomitatum]CUW10779.1 FIG00773263: hypothetical protein [Leuconostoc gasicomitatum]